VSPSVRAGFTFSLLPYIVNHHKRKRTMVGFNYPGVDVSNATAVAIWYETHDIPQRYNPAIVVASVLVSLLGSYSTLIVLGKRTSNSGARNAALLVWAAMTMSCVGIWGMHFIGMNFKLEPVPGQGWYISFSPAFTVFSLIVPFVALVMAFIFVDFFTLKMWRIAVSGTLTGCIVGLMHYSASMKCNFQVRYAPAQTAASIVLACICANIALTLFFKLRSQWQDSWQRRLLCSVILSVGVSGMHYLGSSGTSYRMRPTNVNNLDKLAKGQHGNTTVVIIVAVMAFVITMASAVMSIIDVLSQREIRKKARKIVLASASFDHMGRLMVKADGSLPMVVLEESILRHSEVLDALDARNEIFQWLFSISWAWQVVVPFLDAIAHRVGQRCGTENCPHEKRNDNLAKSITCPVRSRIFSVFGLDGYSERREQRRRINAEKAANATSHNASGVASKTLALLDFRDRVVDAARRLAEHVEVPMEKVGVFYDHVLPTGTQRQEGAVQALKRKPAKLLRRKDKALAAAKTDAADHTSGLYAEDEEASISTSRAASIFDDGDESEEGVSIFLVREIPVVEQALLAKKGYRFTETRFLATILADRHGVGKPRMDELLDGLRVYAKRGTKPVVQPGGVYAGLFGVRPSTSARQGGLDVLVYNFARHQIPAFRLPDIAVVTPEMRTFLRLLDQMPIDQALRVCERESVRTAERNKAIAKLLLDQAHAQMISDSQSAARSSNGGSDLTSEANKPDDNLRHVLDLQTQEASLQAFQIALYTALEALMQSVRVFPRLNSTARISADILEVPSSLDDSTAPAHVILVQAVLPAERGPVLRSSASVLGGLMGPGAGGSNGSEKVEVAAAVPASLVMPTEKPQNGTPFVFTPYTLFTQTQTMLLRGRTASAFSAEVQQALSLRFNVFPASADQSYASTTMTEKDGKRYSRSDMSQSLYSPDVDTSKALFSDSGEKSDVGHEDNDESRQGDAGSKWFSHIKAAKMIGGGGVKRSRKPDDQHTATTDDQAVVVHLNTSPRMVDQPSPLPSSPDGLVSSQSLGIRRFTQPDSARDAHTAVVIDQSRFARPASEYDEDFVFGGMTSANAAGERRRSSGRSTNMTRSNSSRVRSNAGHATSALGPATPRRRSSVVTDVSSSTGGGHGNLPAQTHPSSSSINKRNGSASGPNMLADVHQGSRRPSTAAIPEHRYPSSSSPTQAPPAMRRQSTARSGVNVVVEDAQHPTLRVHPPPASNATQEIDPVSGNDAANPDSAHARQRLDNWQTRQLRDLERFQPNLLLGVLPSEY
jgi:NO-binding membrane sensor protein with MHYT domain